MPAQKRESKRSYIGLVSDEADQPYTATAQPQSSQPLKDFIHGLLEASANGAAKRASGPRSRGQKLRCARTCRCTVFWSRN
jgi:hypothetical protein